MCARFSGFQIYINFDFLTKTDKVMAKHNKVVCGVVPDLGPYLQRLHGKLGRLYELVCPFCHSAAGALPQNDQFFLAIQALDKSVIMIQLRYETMTSLDAIKL